MKPGTTFALFIGGVVVARLVRLAVIVAVICLVAKCMGVV